MRHHLPARTLLRILALTTALVLPGCGQSPATPPAPGPLPGDPSADPGGTESLLMVQNVEVITALSYPARVLLRIKGDLPNSCTDIDAVSQRRSGREVIVTVTTLRKGEVCAEVLRPVEREVWLDGAFESGEYGLKVNRFERRFRI